MAYVAVVAVIVVTALSLPVIFLQTWLLYY